MHHVSRQTNEDVSDEEVDEEVDETPTIPDEPSDISATRDDTPQEGFVMICVPLRDSRLCIYLHRLCTDHNIDNTLH